MSLVSEHFFGSHIMLWIYTKMFVTSVYFITHRDKSKKLDWWNLCKCIEKNRNITLRQDWWLIVTLICFYQTSNRRLRVSGSHQSLNLPDFLQSKCRNISKMSPELNDKQFIYFFCVEIESLLCFWWSFNESWIRMRCLSIVQLFWSSQVSICFTTVCRNQKSAQQQ